ncbi:MAG: hypothetical protein COT74_01750 [Bdellovibrionales bacterium CG10_big_fil_rev_8_21_14_0_10_45_34]|nr:MAG: hypothetical protein COT74_01750 [Bdellovibrionales bacterium CG10_big_fil_rev_8_21_14_0_10_45_34]
MRFIGYFIVMLTVFGCAGVSKKGRDKNDFSFEDFQKSFSLTDATLSPDGRRVFYITNKNKYPMIWSINLETKKEEQFFDLGRPISNVVFSPNGEYLIFHADHNGDENHEIFSLNLSDKRITELTGKKGARNGLCGWSDDGTTITFMSNARNKSFFDLFSLKMLNNGQPSEPARSLVESDHVNTCGKFSMDGSQYAFIRFLTNTTQEIWAMDLETKKNQKISPPKKAGYKRVQWLSDGKTIVSSSDLHGDFKNLVRLKNGKSASMTNERWNVVDFINDVRASLSYMIVNADGSYDLKFFGQDFKRPKVVNVPRGIVEVKGWSKDGGTALISIETPTSPAELYTLQLSSGELDPITKLNQSPVPRELLSDSQLVRIRSEDGVEFSSWLMKPKPGRSNGKAIVFVHGGPEDQVTLDYSVYRQFFLYNGFTLMIPNFRGSTGYGTKFQKMVYGDWGGGHIKDLLAARNYMVSVEKIDESKIAILGGSFGGFSVLSSITQHPKSYCAAVDIFGPANLFTFIASVPPHWREPIYELVGHPEKDKEKLTERSPFFHLDKIEAPLLVVQGANDPRVVKKESDQLVESLKKKGRYVDYIVFADEGHGFSMNKNQVMAFEKAAEHIEKFCK